MKITYKLGQEIKFEDDIKVKSILSEDKLHIKKGDKAIVIKNGFKIINGEARGKTINFDRNEQIKGCDYKNISKLIYRRLDAMYGVGIYLDNEEIEIDDFLEEVIDVLIDFL